MSDEIQPTRPAIRSVSSAPPVGKPISGAPSLSPPRIQTAPSEPLAFDFAFPEECAGRVRAGMIRADLDFEQWERESLLEYSDRRAFAIRWICRIVAVFGREACQLAQAGAPEWPVSQIEERVSDVLRQLAREASRSKFVGGLNPNLTEGGRIREEVRAVIARSPEWRHYRDELLDLLTKSGGSSDDSAVSVRVERRPEQENQTMSQIVDAFLKRCNQELNVPFTIMRKHIWLAAGHKSPRRLQYWQTHQLIFRERAPFASRAVLFGPSLCGPLPAMQLFKDGCNRTMLPV